MFRPKLYNKHDETMLSFAEKFNNCPVCKDVEMRPNPEETYDNDGIFINVKTNNSFGFDWEYRDKYFSNCKLAFDSLGQYERKLRKPSIQLSLQCDSTETGIAVGWHSDWLLEEMETRALATDYRYKQKNGRVRYTKKFRIYSYEQIDSFKRFVSDALDLSIYTLEAYEYTNKTELIAAEERSEYKVERKYDEDETLQEFFEKKGLVVVDRRDRRGGCLWVVGSESEIGNIIKEARSKFNITGGFAAGSATGGKMGWYTKSLK